ncbi:MAG: ABC1 kinase family protein [Desulfurivibrionaceae bacterium]
MHIKTLARWSRFREIVAVLLKYGFQDVVEEFDVPMKHFLESHIPAEAHDMSRYERIRHGLEELGPSFVKFGQIMSLRPDLLPAELIDELSHLQDDVAPLDFETIRPAVEKSLGEKLEEVFSSFEEEVFAAASLAQVHKAILREDGKEVAVKIRRPDVHDIIGTDISIMETVADHLYGRIEAAEIYNFPALVEEFKKAIYEELDFSHELRNMQIARRNLEDLDWLVIPEPLEKWSKPDILTMDFVKGVKIKALTGEEEHDQHVLAQRVIHLSLTQVLEFGFFHADPHPGNILALPGNRVGVLDWGIVGHLSYDDRSEILDMLEAVIAREPGRILDSFLALGGGKVDEQDKRRALRDINVILDSYLDIPLASGNLGHLLMDIYTLMRKYHLYVPPDLSLIFKTLVTLEGTTRLLDPGMDLVKEIEPFVTEMAWERWHPKNVFHRMRNAFYQFNRLQKDLPRRLRYILQKLETGDMIVRLQHERLNDLRQSIEHGMNRLTMGIIVGAIIMGSSMIITTGIKPLIFGYPALGIIGYAISAVIGFLVLISIFRSRKF